MWTHVDFAKDRFSVCRCCCCCCCHCCCVSLLLLLLLLLLLCFVVAAVVAVIAVVCQKVFLSLLQLMLPLFLAEVVACGDGGTGIATGGGAAILVVVVAGSCKHTL